MIYSDISLYAVASTITLYTYLNINEYSNILTIKKRFFIYSVGYLFPIMIGIYSKIDNTIGINVYWCWIKSEEKNFILINYIIIWFFIFSNFTISFKILRFKHTEYYNQDQAKNNKGYSLKIIIYPIISIIFWFIYSINRIFYDYLEKDFNYIMNVFVIYFNNFEGILYSGIGAYNFRIWKKLKNLFFKWIKNLNKKEDEINKTSEIKHDDLMNNSISKEEMFLGEKETYIS